MHGRVAGGLCLALVPVGTLVACGEGGSADAGPVHRDSAGVEIVDNAGPDRPLDVELERLFALGGADEGPASFYSLSPGHVAADASGRLYVLDQAAFRVVVFDSTGRHLRSMGREGGGPGELERPWSLAVGPGDTAWVFDFAKRGLVRFAPDGEPSGTVRVELPYFGGGMAVTARGSIFEVGGITDRLSRLVVAGPADTVTVDSLRLPEGGEIAFESCPMRFRGTPPLFQPSLTWAARGGRAVVNDRAAYQLDVYEVSGEGAVRTGSWRRDLVPAPATRERAVAEVGRDGMQVGVGGRTITCDAEEAVELRGFADVVPPIEGLAWSPDGHVWVQREHGRDEPFPIDVFAPDGRYLGTLPPGAPWPVAFPGPGRIAAIETDALDVDRVVVYRLGGEAGSSLETVEGVMDSAERDASDSASTRAWSSERTAVAPGVRDRSSRSQ